MDSTTEQRALPRDMRWQELAHRVRLHGEKFDPISRSYNRIRYDINKLSNCSVGLLHYESAGYLFGSTNQILLNWITDGDRSLVIDTDTHSRAWHLSDILLSLPSRLESATAQYDLLSDCREANGTSLTDLGSLMIGMHIELMQSVALCCELALKSLFSYNNPGADANAFRTEIGHSLINAWSRLDDVHVDVLRLFNSMPLFRPDDSPRAVTDENDVVENLLSTGDSYDVIRYGMADRSTPRVKLTFNTKFLLRLAWAVTLRLFQTAWRSGDAGEHR